MVMSTHFFSEAGLSLTCKQEALQLAPVSLFNNVTLILTSAIFLLRNMPLGNGSGTSGQWVPLNPTGSAPGSRGQVPWDCQRLIDL